MLNMFSEGLNKAEYLYDRMCTQSCFYKMRRKCDNYIKAKFQYDTNAAGDFFSNNITFKTEIKCRQLVNTS